MKKLEVLGEDAAMDMHGSHIFQGVKAGGFQGKGWEVAGWLMGGVGMLSADGVRRLRSCALCSAGGESALCVARNPPAMQITSCK